MLTNNSFSSKTTEDKMARSAKMLFITLTFVCWAALVPAFAADPQPKARNDDSTQLKAAREERVKVLTELSDLMAAQYKIGNAEPAQVFAVETDLCNAQLELTDDTEKRIALLTKLVDKAGAFLKLTESRRQAAHVSLGYLLQARSLYLEAKIRLLQERGGKRLSPPGTASTIRFPASTSARSCRRESPS
jgi:hypothetical protein